MLRTLLSISSLLFGLGVLLVGVGLLGTVLGIRAGLANFGDSLTGVVMAFYFAGYVIGTMTVPALIRRVGHIRVFAALAAVACAAAVAHGLLVDPLAWAVLRLITGACLVGVYMAIESWLSALSPNPMRGRVFGTYMTVSLLALGAGQFLLLVGDIRGLTPFAIVAILIALGLVPVALTRVREPHAVETPHLQVQSLWRTAPLGSLGAAVAGLILGAFWGLGALFGQRIGLPHTAIALLMSATILGGALLQWPIGHLSDHHDRRVILTAVSIVGAILAVAVALAVHISRPALYASTFLFGGCAFTVYSLSVAHVQDRLDQDHALEATRSLLLIYGLGAVMGPAAAGMLMGRLGALSLPLYDAALLTVLGLFAMRRIRTVAPVPAEEQAQFAPMVRTTQAALEMHPATEAESDPNAS